MIREFPGGKTLQLLQGDITKVPADAIVTAANAELRGGGGVDGAIQAAAGPAIRVELDQLQKEHGGCPTGQAVGTAAGQLPAKYLFHAVGPVYRDGTSGESEQLAAVYRRCLELAEEREVTYISFPAISTGTYGYPQDSAARIALEVATSHLQNEGNKVQKILFVLFDKPSLQAWSTALRELMPATAQETV